MVNFCQATRESLKKTSLLRVLCGFLYLHRQHKNKSTELIRSSGPSLEYANKSSSVAFQVASFTCNVCDERFYSEAARINHEDTLHGEKVYKRVPALRLPQIVF